MFRIGQGYGSHAPVPGRSLILGGVCRPAARGLLGHSDADALLHAVTDALPVPTFFPIQTHNVACYDIGARARAQLRGRLANDC